METINEYRLTNVTKNESKINKEIEVVDTRFFEGPNVHALFPVFEAKVDLGDLEETPSNPLFAEKLVDLFPELAEHSCSKGYPGGFIERLNEGTYPGHIIEHTTIAIHNMVGVPVSYGKCRKQKDGLYRIVVEYDFKEMAHTAFKGAVKVVNDLLVNLSNYDNLKDYVEELIDEVKYELRMEKPGPSTKSILDAAKERKIPFKRIHDDFSLYSLGWGKHREMIWGPVTSKTPLIGSDIGKEKDICKNVLMEHEFPVPRGYIAYSLEDAFEIAEDLGYPVVLKPDRGHHGEGVEVNLKNKDELKDAYDIAREHSKYILVEKYLQGDDYRVLVIGNQVVAVAKRIPAHIVGNGTSTIEELVQLTNQDPARGEGHSGLLTKLKLDEEELACLKRQGITPKYVPKESETIYLRNVANLSTGGTAEDHTDELNPELKRILEKVSKVIGMDVMGIDVIAGDISKSPAEIDWGIIEVNASPGLRMHLSPTKGQPRLVGKYIVDNLFPEGNGRIPLIAITGTNGKTTTARLTEWIARNQGYHTGLAVTGGIYSAGHKYEDGDTTGPWSAGMVLKDPDVDFAVLETARGGMVKRGLGFDRCSVSVVTNIREDHIGLNGIDDLEDLFWVKSLLVDATEKGGYSVINANDDFAERLISKTKGKPVLFSIEKNQLIESHVKEGNTAFVYEGSKLVKYEKGERTDIIDVNDVPFLLGGVEMMVENALAAIAATYSSGIELEVILTALSTFKMNEEMNPGRMNIFEVDGKKVIVDYAHNPDAVRGLGELVSHVPAKKKIIVFAGVGNRKDDSLKKCGKEVSKWFDDIIITENTKVLRGRPIGQMSSIIADSVRESGKEPTIKNDIREAIPYAVNKATEDDLVILADLDLESDDIEDILLTNKGLQNLDSLKSGIEFEGLTTLIK
ncbi:MAG: cyanophycin synthetase [Thermoplasmatota archaeon]